MRFVPGHEDLPPGVSLVPLSQLHEWERNYRLGDVEAIKKSIRRFGFNGVLKVWQGGVVMAGNHALKALRSLQEEDAKALPANCVADPDGGWLIPCVGIERLTYEEAQAFALADNKTASLGSNDELLLDELLSELGDFDASLIEDAGFDLPDIEETPAPNFQPSDDGTKFGEPKKVKCPKCGEEFEI